MNFYYSTEEESIIEEAGRLLRSLFTIDRFGSGIPGSAWRQLADKGWLTASLADADNRNIHLSRPVLAGIAREAGRNLLGTDFVINAVALPRLFALAKSADHRRVLLEEHVSRGGGWLLADARRMSLATASYSTSARCCFGATEGLPVYQLEDRSGGSLLLHRWTDYRLSTHQVGGLSVTMLDATISDGAPESIELEGDLETLNADVRNCHSAALVGLADEALARTVDYSKERSQFGGPIGRFQALKHLLADVHVRNEVAWNTVLYASADDGSCDERRVSSLCAAIQANMAAMESVKVMAQCFGGVGYTWESPVHYFLKRALEECHFQGGADRAAFELGTEVLNSECSA